MQKNRFAPLFLLLVCLWQCNTAKREPTAPYQTQTATKDGYTYQFVTNDPLNVRVYELKNGLKVYLSVYKDAPRIQSYIAVKAGGKSDPANATGLAHYLEHMMFKGTDQLGSLDWGKEKVLLDSIEHMFEHYRTLTDTKERKAYYTKIDQVSNEAAKYAIANEYDKLLSKIGTKGLNAHTTEDRTVYQSDIPANELERFLQIESDRFRKIVNRLFHTELEAVYEEKNRSLDDDGWKSYEALYAALFKKHPYGTQTVIGTIDHLKNPSITEIVHYFNKYYVPNNVAICLSGDLDPERTIQLVENYFGSWETKPMDTYTPITEEPISAPRVVEVIGPDAESVQMGFRFPGRNHPDYKYLTVVDMLLANSQAGLIDLHLKQSQKVLDAGCYVNFMNDYSVHTLYGNPREGQSLEQVRDLLLAQIDSLKQGKFDDWLIGAVITDLKKSRMQQYESNAARAYEMVVAFTTDTDWQTYISELDEMEKMTKQDIIQFVNKYYGTNYAVVFKRTGEDPNKQQVEKPQITKVPVNREAQSAYYKQLVAQTSPKLQPVFLDYKKDIQEVKMQSDVPVLYAKNSENELFDLYYLLDAGQNADPKLGLAVQYLEYLGTDKLSAVDVKKELYKVGCSFQVSASEDRMYVVLSGLDENMEKAMELLEGLLANPKADEQALKDMVEGIIKEREDKKKDKSAILYEGLMNYGKYGAHSPYTNVLNNAQLQQLKPADLLPYIQSIPQTEHQVWYYGPRDASTLVTVVNEKHPVPASLKPLPAVREFPEMDSKEPSVYWVDYDMVQAEILFMHKGNTFNKTVVPASRLFNEYIGALAFQEIREAQGLAYSVWSNYGVASKFDKADFVNAYVGTQADKQSEAMKAMMQLINELPLSEDNFTAAKEAILSKIESERITKSAVLFNYENARRLKLDYDIRQDVYNAVKNMTMDDLKKFQQDFIKGKQYSVLVLGSKNKLNFKELAKYGKVKQLSLDEVFGYEKTPKLVVN